MAIQDMSVCITTPHSVVIVLCVDLWHIALQTFKHIPRHCMHVPGFMRPTFFKKALIGL